MSLEDRGSDLIQYLDESVHVGLYVSDGHPLHDDVQDPPLQCLPLLTGCLGETATTPQNPLTLLDTSPTPTQRERRRTKQVNCQS